MLHAHALGVEHGQHALGLGQVLLRSAFDQLDAPGLVTGHALAAQGHDAQGELGLGKSLVRRLDQPLDALGRVLGQLVPGEIHPGQLVLGLGVARPGGLLHLGADLRQGAGQGDGQHCQEQEGGKSGLDDIHGASGY